MQFVTIATEAGCARWAPLSPRFHDENALVTRNVTAESTRRVTASTSPVAKPVALLTPYSPTLSPILLTMFSTEYSSPNSSPAPSGVAIGKLPPLPKIRSGRIRKRVFTHCSLAGENKYDFQAPESDPSTDNEE